MDYFFPQDWTPITPPPVRAALTDAERQAGRAALVTSQGVKNSNTPPGFSRMPLTWEEALAVVRTAVPGRTNDELHEILVWAQTLWHPKGASLYTADKTVVEAGGDKPEI